MNLNDVKQFLSQFDDCVLATVDDISQPEAATVGYTVDENFKIMFATNIGTRKAVNLKTNQKVALVVGFDGPKTVQIEGVAEVVDKEEHKSRISIHLEKIPGAKEFADKEGQTYYLITPTWLRFTDYTQSPDTFETKVFS